MVTATLPAGVEWIDQQSITLGNSIVFEPGTRRLTWPLGTLAPTVENSRTVAASVAIALTPIDAERGTVPLLLTNVALNGFDTWVEKSVSFRGSNITTRISEDKGVVR